MGPALSSDYGAHAVGVIPKTHEQRKPRKVRKLADDFVKRPAEDMITEYGELIDEVEATITRARAFLAGDAQLRS